MQAKYLYTRKIILNRLLKVCRKALISTFLTLVAYTVMLRVLPLHLWFVVDMLKIPKSMCTSSKRKLLFTHCSISQFLEQNPMKEELAALSASLSHPVYSAMSSSKISLLGEKHPCLRGCRQLMASGGGKSGFLKFCVPEGQLCSSGRAHTGVYMASRSWTECVIGGRI